MEHTQESSDLHFQVRKKPEAAFGTNRYALHVSECM